MGNYAYEAYRHRDMYLAILIKGYDLATPILQSMRQPGAIRTAQEKVLKMHESNHRQDEWEGIVYYKRPLFSYCTYEVDLDRKIFYIDGIPFFTLECLPSDEVFLKCLSEDHYRNVACAVGCPPEHMYKRPALPVVDDSEFATYHSLVSTGTDVALSDLLGISDVLSPCEHIRASLLQTMIGQCMVKKDEVGGGEIRKTVVPTMHQFGLVSNHNQLTDQEWSLLPTSRLFRRYSMVIHLATHLDDERCLLTSISRLIDEILEQKDNPGEYFGIAFSIFHCAIVKVVKDTDATTFSHMGVLQFLPSFFADSPSTPGITALARLGYRIDSALFARAMQVFCVTNPKTKGRHTEAKEPLTEDAKDALPKTSSSVLPPELWREIAFHLRLHDLFAFGLASKLCRGIASILLRYPHIYGYRLVGFPKEQPKRLQDDYRFLRATSFLAVQGSIPAIVMVGLGGDIIDITSTFGGSSLDVRFSVHDVATPEENLIADSDSESAWMIVSVKDESGYEESILVWLPWCKTFAVV
ncbi:hypothetical protein K503DRAFT_867925 [Rhizopogon vinicolor AM-OR11-026]|uniref:F-box domain-containing protein n=1 Tax=Rhizopogon vinicolor AM-OR11-026 TaxID=1314800 RepID=A0A1B7MTI4_9AGAM|nr:hypothetical protein K503DRAFT_867925 [Rhizopogon vinicolor AM-OR11-026]